MKTASEKERSRKCFIRQVGTIDRDCLVAIDTHEYAIRLQLNALAQARLEDAFKASNNLVERELDDEDAERDWTEVGWGSALDPAEGWYITIRRKARSACVTSQSSYSRSKWHHDG